MASINNDLYYYHTNHLGSIICLTDINAKFIESIEYDVSGQPNLLDEKNAMHASSLIDNPFYYSAHYYDIETCLYDNRIRSFSSNIGRFMQKDYIVYSDGFNDYKHVLNSPIVYVDITGFKPDFYEASALAKAGYADNVEKQINVNGNTWNRIRTYDDPKTGFHAALFEKNGEYVLSTSGTNPLSGKDWSNNIRQALGLDASQYNQSIDLAKTLSDWAGDCELTFVGHSLGGGLASANSSRTGRDAITFNAAALNKKYDYNMKSNIDAYITKGDILHSAQGLIGQTAKGNQMDNPNNPGQPFLPPIFYLNPYLGSFTAGYNLGTGIINHTSY